MDATIVMKRWAIVPHLVKSWSLSSRITHVQQDKVNHIYCTPLVNTQQLSAHVFSTITLIESEFSTIVSFQKFPY